MEISRVIPRLGSGFTPARPPQPGKFPRQSDATWPESLSGRGSLQGAVPHRGAARQLPDDARPKQREGDARRAHRQARDGDHPPPHGPEPHPGGGGRRDQRGAEGGRHPRQETSFPVGLVVVVGLLLGRARRWRRDCGVPRVPRVAHNPSSPAPRAPSARIPTGTGGQSPRSLYLELGSQPPFRRGRRGPRGSPFLQLLGPRAGFTAPSGPLAAPKVPRNRRIARGPPPQPPPTLQRPQEGARQAEPREGSSSSLKP